MSNTSKSISAARAKAADLAKRRAASARSTESHGPYGGTSSAAVHVDSAGANDQRHYLAMRDTCFNAIRPIANRFAGQAIRIAMVPKRKQGKTLHASRMAAEKAARKAGYLGSKFEERQKDAWRKMPDRVKHALPPTAVVLDEHEFTEAIYRPNAFLTAYQTMYLSCASLLTCGRSLLLWDEKGKSLGHSGDPSASAYYCPMHWALPVPGKAALQAWTIRPPNVDEYEVGHGEFIYMSCPDPANPFGSLSPMRAVRRPINTEDKIGDAQQAEMDNLIKPSYAVVIGQQMAQNGQKQRARLGKKQRREVVNAIKGYIGGAMRAGEPILLDALIEDIKDISPKNDDIGFEKGGKLTEDKIMKSFGVSPLIAGWVQNANRAGSTTAHELFFDVVLNPILTMSGEAFTHALGPKYSTDEFRVVIYHEKAIAEDSDSMINRVKLFPEALRGEEKRRFMRTGELEYVDSDAPESAEFSNVWTGNEDRDEDETEPKPENENENESTD